MSVILKPAESYREAFSFRNSEAAIARFPFPVSPKTPTHVFGEYRAGHVARSRLGLQNTGSISTSTIAPKLLNAAHRAAKRSRAGAW